MSVAEDIGLQSYQLKSTNDLNPLLDRVGDAHCVMLGEASHGTHEYYTWRSAISKRLIREKGFDFIAVEGDWPDCYRLNRFIKGYAHTDKESRDLLHDFKRWPTWMWANWEIDALLNWLKDHNQGQPANKRVGFYGLDVYSLWESMEALVHYLEKNDPGAANLAKQAIHCFEPFSEDPHEYARAQIYLGASCKPEVVKLLSEIRKKAPIYDHDPEAALNTEQNAHIAVNAEEYYSNMMGFNDNTWNLRDTHMIETLNRIFQFYGKGAKGIVWEHNTHIGDARYTDMRRHAMHNTGQLAREQYSEQDTVLVGFGSYAGTVMAGEEWGAPMEAMKMPEARSGSWEEHLHSESADARMLIFDRDEEIKEKQVPHRAIGVVYNPKMERHSNYVPSVINRRYDAFIYIDQTKALHAMHLKPDGHMVPETYPFNF